MSDLQGQRLAIERLTQDFNVIIIKEKINIPKSFPKQNFVTINYKKKLCYLTRVIIGIDAGLTRRMREEVEEPRTGIAEIEQVGAPER